MTTQKDPLEVIVQGGDVEANTLVFGVVQHALDNAGFTDVSVHSPQGDVPCDVEEVPTLLDVVRANRPHLFDTPIRVEQRALGEDVLAMSTDDPGAIGLAKVVYGGGLEEAGVVATVEAEVLQAMERDDFADPVQDEDVAY
jgi:hypothetical protein